MGNSIGIHGQEYTAVLPERLSDERLMKLEAKTRCSKDKIEQYYQDFRLNHPTGYITKKEFLHAYKLLFPHSKHAMRAFRKADLKHSGKINFFEYVIAMEQNSQREKLTVPGCSLGQVTHLIKEGSLDYMLNDADEITFLLETNNMSFVSAMSTVVLNKLKLLIQIVKRLYPNVTINVFTILLRRDSECIVLSIAKYNYIMRKAFEPDRKTSSKMKEISLPTTNITLIWNDKNIDGKEDTKETSKMLSDINNYAVFSTGWDKCVK
ncbi:unnamed protein product [Didymodactylos carnosus]|uniref:EF-hand domain-containing protein n=1 Tax=Didymodactylos carnosus TaxID=1234261 RepID=A0A814EKQ4_9BILA|nr:unnamed protein product [Didymodactylos carnosus]CAF1038449.1 unnamed protein product [Didymodactylos carnosus]CAF3743844.1 unnamed protein product [Didymodactylos carnosus]CAF3806589.1 unnamed protein product [Didymodactylos carnosus]